MGTGITDPSDPNSPEARAARDAALEGTPSTTGQPIPLPDAMTSQPVPPEDGSPESLAAQTAAALSATGGSSSVTPTPVAPAGAAPAVQVSGSGVGDNIVEYALRTSNPPGVRLYSRSGINLEAKAQRNCAKYPSPDKAQIAFLKAGGPQKDRHSLDPDGDGYACRWDPTPYRRAVQG